MPKETKTYNTLRTSYPVAWSVPPMEILDKYSTDSNFTGTDKITGHSYGPIYEKIFNELSTRNNVKILEIGVFSGAFTQVMHELFPNAEIYGVDINLKNYLYPQDNPKIHLFEMDGTKEKTAEFLNESFDLIIEDGSHMTVHQKKSLDVFAPYLKRNGIYITEDIAQGNPELRKDLETIGLKHNLRMEWFDMTDQKQRFDDIVAVFHKKY
jgi:predicted O-methyltransferase YrrM